MKKLFALASIAALAACGGNTDEPSEDTSIDEAVADVIPATKAGTYTSTTPDGAEVVVALNLDGTYTVTENGEQVESGTWEDNIRGTCLMAEGGDGENCFNIQEGADGMVDITGPDGQTSSYRFES